MREQFLSFSLVYFDIFPKYYISDISNEKVI